MEYQIAVASSDGIHSDLSFGEAEKFLIYRVNSNQEYRLAEIRNWDESDTAEEKEDVGCRSGCTNVHGGAGCGGANIRKVSLIEDCRSIVCSKVGLKVRKQFEARAISVFDIDTEIQKALEKIIAYYERIDHHQNLKA